VLLAGRDPHQVARPDLLDGVAHRWTRPTPARDDEVCPRGWLCQAVRAPARRHGGAEHASRCFRLNCWSTRTEPVKFSAGPGGTAALARRDGDACFPGETLRPGRRRQDGCDCFMASLSFAARRSLSPVIMRCAASEYRAPTTSMRDAAASISRRSSAVSSTSAAPRFSWRRAGFVVREWAPSTASARAPGERDLRRRRSLAAATAATRSRGLVRPAVLGREARDGVAEVRAVEGRSSRRSCRSGSPCPATEGHEADAQLLERRQDRLLRLRTTASTRSGAPPPAAPRCARGWSSRRLGQAEVPDLTLLDELRTAPATSSIGTLGSTRCWYSRSITSVRRRPREASVVLRIDSGRLSSPLACPPRRRRSRTWSRSPRASRTGCSASPPSPRW